MSVLFLMSSGLTNLAQNYGKAMRNVPYLTVLGDFLDIESERYQGTLPVEKRDDNDYVLGVKNVNAPFVILDEPTAALDPISETTWCGAGLQSTSLTGFRSAGSATLSVCNRY